MKQIFLWIVLSIVSVVFVDGFFVVSETERAVLLRFKKVEKIDVAPGLHLKWPVIETVRKFDRRVLTLDSTPESYFTVENKRVIVDSFVKWRIINVDQYYKATSGDERRTFNLLSQRVAHGLRSQFGTRTVHEVVSGERDMLMKVITDQLNEIVQETLGIEVLDVRVKRIDLPEDVSESVYRRMQAGREQEAREHRAMGREQAEITRSEADKKSTILEAEAYKEAEKIRGEGDAKSAHLYAEAYKKDAEFYAFFRSLQGYRTAFKSQGDMMILDPDSAFFRYLKAADGKR